MKTIDVHSHTVPQIYLDALQSGAVRNTDGFPISEWTGSLYFDLAAATHPGFLAALKETHDPSMLLMGFDFPFMPAVTIGRAKAGC